MAFETVSSYAKTVFIGDEKDAGQVKTWTGYVTGVRVVKKKNEKFTFIDAQTGRGDNAEQVSVMACGQVVAALCVKDSDKNATGLKPEVDGCQVRLTYLGKEKVAGFKQPLNQVKVEVDRSDKLEQ